MPKDTDVYIRERLDRMKGKGSHKVEAIASIYSFLEAILEKVELPSG